MRDNWNDYFMGIARIVATRATCDRKHVGAVIVRDKTILSTGYNGSARGLKHCDDEGHLMIEGHCVRTVHAEINAIAQAARNGVSLDNSQIYITALPCWNCFKTLVNAGVNKIYYREAYRPDPITESAADDLGIELIKVGNVGEADTETVGM
jgi:dCMP deaminase